MEVRPSVAHSSWEEWATDIARREVRSLEDRCRREVGSLGDRCRDDAGVLEGGMRRVEALEERLEGLDTRHKALVGRVDALEERLEGLNDVLEETRERLPLRVSALEIAVDANTRHRQHQDDDPSSQSLAERITLLETQIRELGLSPAQQPAGPPPAGPIDVLINTDYPDAPLPPAPSAPPPQSVQALDPMAGGPLQASAAPPAPAGPPPPPPHLPGLILAPFMRVPPTPEPDQGRCDHFRPEWFVETYAAGHDEFKGAKDIGDQEHDAQSNKLWNMGTAASTMWDLAFEGKNGPPQLYNILKYRPTLEIDNHNPSASGGFYVRLGFLRCMKMTPPYQPHYENSAHGLDIKYKDMKSEPKIRQAMRSFIAEVIGCDHKPSFCRFRLGESAALPCLALENGVGSSSSSSRVLDGEVVSF